MQSACTWKDIRESPYATDIQIVEAIVGIAGASLFVWKYRKLRKRYLHAQADLARTRQALREYPDRIIGRIRDLHYSDQVFLSILVKLWTVQTLTEYASQFGLLHKAIKAVHPNPQARVRNLTAIRESIEQAILEVRLSDLAGAQEPAARESVVVQAIQAYAALLEVLGRTGVYREHPTHLEEACHFVVHEVEQNSNPQTKVRMITSILPLLVLLEPAGDRPALAAYRLALADDNEQIRMAALRGFTQLSNLGDDQRLDLLIHAHPDANVAPETLHRWLEHALWLTESAAPQLTSAQKLRDLRQMVDIHGRSREDARRELCKLTLKRIDSLLANPDCSA